MASRALYRAEVETSGGSVDLRLVLSRGSDGAFELDARDALGRGLWRLRAVGGRAVWLDEERGIFCRLGTETSLRLPGIEWNVAVSSLPELLSGSYPNVPATGREGDLEIVEQAARTFRGERQNGTWSRWTLRESGAPSAWWTRSAGESQLVLRDPPVRVRWRLTAQAPLAEEITNVEPPPGSREVECRDGEIP